MKNKLWILIITALLSNSVYAGELMFENISKGGPVASSFEQQERAYQRNLEAGRRTQVYQDYLKDVDSTNRNVQAFQLANPNVVPNFFDGDSGEYGGTPFILHNVDTVESVGVLNGTIPSNKSFEVLQAQKEALRIKHPDLDVTTNEGLTEAVNRQNLRAGVAFDIFFSDPSKLKYKVRSRHGNSGNYRYVFEMYNTDLKTTYSDYLNKHGVGLISYLNERQIADKYGAQPIGSGRYQVEGEEGTFTQMELEERKSRLFGETIDPYYHHYKARGVFMNALARLEYTINAETKAIVTAVAALFSDDKEFIDKWADKTLAAQKKAVLIGGEAPTFSYEWGITPDLVVSLLPEVMYSVFQYLTASGIGSLLEERNQGMLNLQNSQDYRINVNSKTTPEERAVIDSLTKQRGNDIEKVNNEHDGVLLAKFNTNIRIMRESYPSFGAIPETIYKMSPTESIATIRTAIKLDKDAKSVYTGAAKVAEDIGGEIANFDNEGSSELWILGNIFGTPNHTGGDYEIDGFANLVLSSFRDGSFVTSNPDLRDSGLSLSSVKGLANILFYHEISLNKGKFDTKGLHGLFAGSDEVDVRGDEKVLASRFKSKIGIILTYIVTKVKNYNDANPKKAIVNLERIVKMNLLPPDLKAFLHSLTKDRDNISF